MPNSTPAPKRLKSTLMQRIAAEPARVETDAEGRLVAINPAFSGLCGYSFAEVAGKKPGSFLQGSGTDPEAVASLRAAVAAGAPCSVELVNYHKDGHPYRVRILLEPVRNRRGSLTGFRAEEVEIPLQPENR